MPGTAKKTIRLATTVYWILLFYIIAALVWWFVTLEKQNREITKLKYDNYEFRKDSFTLQQNTGQVFAIDDTSKRNSIKYVAEGITFLLLILLGALYVYRSVKKQFRLQQQQQNFMMAVTHELKTPIAVARLNLETIQKHNLDPEKQKKLIRLTLDETVRLNTLTNNILVSSQLEGDAYSMNKEELDLSTLLHDRLQDFRTRFADRSFTEEIEDDVALPGDDLLLQMMINNLVENAIKYSPRDKPITCRLHTNNNLITLCVEDYGPGIEDEEKKNVFEKFYRIGNESTRKTQGTGLGLYLCKKIAADHNADILVTNNLPSGSIFTVNFKT